MKNFSEVFGGRIFEVLLFANLSRRVLSNVGSQLKSNLVTFVSAYDCELKLMALKFTSLSRVYCSNIIRGRNTTWCYNGLFEFHSLDGTIMAVHAARTNSKSTLCDNRTAHLRPLL